MAMSMEEEEIAQMLAGVKRDGEHLSLACRPFGHIPGTCGSTDCTVYFIQMFSILLVLTDYAALLWSSYILSAFPEKSTKFPVPSAVPM